MPCVAALPQLNEGGYKTEGRILQRYLYGCMCTPMIVHASDDRTCPTCAHCSIATHPLASATFPFHLPGLLKYANGPWRDTLPHCS